MSVGRKEKISKDGACRTQHLEVGQGRGIEPIWLRRSSQ